MFAHRIDEVLAQTDPFDLAQAVERCVSQLNGRDIRTLLSESRDRMSDYYLEEIEHLRKTRMNDQQLRREFTGFLRSNLRAITLFGSAFSSAVLAECPAHRVVAIGEEPRGGRNTRAFLIGGVALALVVLGAAGEHAVTNARVASQVPTEPSAPVVVPPMLYPTVRPLVAKVEHPKQVRSTPAPTMPPPTPAPPTPAPITEPAVASTEAPTATQLAPILNQTAIHRPGPGKTPQPGRAVLTINVTPPPPTPEPSPLDVTDMPDSMSDATPMPQQSLMTAGNPDAGGVPTPKPTDRPVRGMLKHLDPFRHGGHVRVPL